MPNESPTTTDVGALTPSDLVRAHLPTGAPVRAVGVDAQRRLVIAALRAHSADMARLGSDLERALAELESAGDDRRARDLVSDTATRTVPRWHFAMLNDHERTAAFTTALEKQVRPGSHVLDIGSGSGLLAMTAVAAGAGRVTTCETNPLLAELAEQIIEEHGLSDVITVINRKSSDLVVGRDLEPADAIVSEIVDCGLVGEDMFATMRHARSELLAPGGLVIPSAARLHAFVVDSPVAAGLNRVGMAGGFDVRLFNVVATRRHFPVRLDTWPYRPLSATEEVARFDLRSDPLEDSCRTVGFDIAEDGEAYGLVVWFELDLGEDIVLRNSPANVRSHWMQALVLFEAPRCVERGERLDAEIAWLGDSLVATPLGAGPGVTP